MHEFGLNCSLPLAASSCEGNALKSFTYFGDAFLTMFGDMRLPRSML
jgi:hypothetical protein